MGQRSNVWGAGRVAPAGSHIGGPCESWCVGFRPAETAPAAGGRSAPSETDQRPTQSTIRALPPPPARSARGMRAEPREAQGDAALPAAGARTRNAARTICSTTTYLVVSSGASVPWGVSGRVRIEEQMPADWADCCLGGHWGGCATGARYGGRSTVVISERFLYNGSVCGLRAGQA